MGIHRSNYGVLFVVDPLRWPPWPDRLIAQHIDMARAAGEMFDPWTKKGHRAFLARNKPKRRRTTTPAA